MYILDLALLLNLKSAILASFRRDKSAKHPSFAAQHGREMSQAYSLTPSTSLTAGRSAA
jgi:hypothetical protein